MKKKLIKLFLPLFLLIFSLSCEKNKIFESQKSILNKEISTNEAKQWFENNVQNKSNLRESAEENRRNLRWDLASKSLAFYKDNAVIIPIQYEKDYSYKYYLDKDKQKKEKNKKPEIKYSSSSFDKLVIYKDEKGNFHEEVIQVVIDQESLAKNLKKDKNQYFDGLIVVKNWAGDFIKALKFKNGNLIGKGTNKPQQAKNLRPTEQICINYQDCTEWEYWWCYYSPSCSCTTYCYMVAQGSICSYWSECYYQPDDPEQSYIEFFNYSGQYEPSGHILNFSDPCIAFNRMRELQSFYSKEFNGLAYTNSNGEIRYMILPAEGNTFTTSNWPAYIPNVSIGGVYYNVSIDYSNNSITVVVPGFNVSANYNIIGTFHSHPNSQDINGTILSYLQPSPADIDFANSHPNIYHQIWREDGRMNYNGSGLIGSIQPCP